MKSILLTLVSLLFAATAHAQWQSTTYTLKGGWNSIYLHGDASYATLETIFASQPAVQEVWRWNPNPTQVQFTTSPLIPSAGTAEWSTWVRGQPGQSTLAALSGGFAYLVKCNGTTSNSYSVTIPQKVMPPSASWVRNGANLMGLPSYKNGSSYPTMAAYFATFPAAIASNVKVYKYAGGELGPGNPVQVYSTYTERLDRNQAYWFQSAVVGNFYAPIEITPSNSAGLDFGRTGSTISVRLRNRSDATVTVTISPVASGADPSGVTSITGSVPLTLRAANGTATPFSGTSVVIGPQSVVEVKFGIDRGAMSAGSGAFYASLLRFRDSSNLMDVLLPARATVASLAGLWVGDALVTNVASKAATSTGGSTTPRPFPLRFILHVDEAGTARLLSQVFSGTLADPGNPDGLCTRESGLKPDAKAAASRMGVGHLPLDQVIIEGSGDVALGATLTRIVRIPHTDPTNPFVHTYHPDHDNKDARPDGTNTTLAAGVESYTVKRTCQFMFTTSPPEGTSSVGWGSTVIGGNYTETLSGLHRQDITTSGSFTLRRASENGAITVN